MLIYSFITDYQAFNLRYKDNTTRDKNETKVDKQSANLGKNNEPIQNRLSFLIDCKSVILHHLAILSFPMVRPAWDNWWLLVDNNEYSPGETFEYDFKANNRLDFDFIPATEGEAYIVMGVASELVTRSDSIKLKVSSPEINIRFRNVPDLMLVSEEAEFYLQLDTELYGVKASARFVKGSGRVYISGYDATRGEGVALEKNNLVTFRPDATGQAVIEFTVSSRYGLPVKENVTIQVNQ